MHLQPLYRSFPYYGHGISDMLFKYGLCLPSGSNLSKKERKRVADAVNGCLRSIRLPVRLKQPLMQNGMNRSIIDSIEMP